MDSIKFILLLSLNFFFALLVSFAINVLPYDLSIILAPQGYLPELTLLILFTVIFFAISGNLYAVMSDSIATKLVVSTISLLGLSSGFLIDISNKDIAFPILQITLLFIGVFSFQRKFDILYTTFIKPNVGLAVNQSYKALIFPLAMAATFGFYFHNANKPLQDFIPDNLIKDYFGPNISNGEFKIPISIPGYNMSNLGIRPADIQTTLDSIGYPTQDKVVQKAVQDQVETIIKPYEKFIPVLLSISFYFLLSLVFTIARFFVSPAANFAVYLGIKSKYYEQKFETVEVTKIQI